MQIIEITQFNLLVYWNLVLTGAIIAICMVIIRLGRNFAKFKKGGIKNG